MPLQPYKFVPIYKEKIWGGRSLERLFGRTLPSRVPIGESWELADLPEGQSVVAEGPEAGRSLRELLAEHGEAILGRVRPLSDGRFPLLLKLLDATEILSLQVHPDEDAVRRLGPPAALKTECWYVIESRRGYILKGMRPGVTADRLAQTLLSDDARVLESLVQRYDVRAGDFHYLPAGTVHALGPGVVVAEIQTPSDTTYRVSDWGRGRDIQVQAALDCTRFTPSDDRPPGHDGQTLVSSPYFTVRLLTHPPGAVPLTGGRCEAWMVLRGRGRVASGDSGQVAVGPGDTLLLPAGLRQPVLEVQDEMTWLETTLQAWPAE